MKTQNLFWVVLLVCITQSFFLIYLSSHIRILEEKVEHLSEEQNKSVELKQAFLSNVKQNFKQRHDKRLETIRAVIRQELDAHHAQLMAAHSGDSKEEDSLKTAETLVEKVSP